MTLRFSKFSRLVAQLAPNHHRCQRLKRASASGLSRVLRTVGACAVATLLVHPAQAQVGDGLFYPGTGYNSASPNSIVGSSVITPADRMVGEFEDGGAVTGSGVYVSPGGSGNGMSSSLNVPSAIGPATEPSRTRYVNQPYAQGPFMQSQPVAQQPMMQQPMMQGSGYGMPCPSEPGCDVSYYGSVEALYFRRDHDERFTLSQNTRIPPFDYEWAGRVTVGRLFDCVNGYEFSYAGPFKWERDRIIAGAGLESKLSQSGFIPNVLTAFNNATLHSQLYQARLNTYEVNRRWWAWDIFSTLIGLRVVDYRENYGFFSTSAAGNGLYQDQTRNLMVGPQIGGELMTPVGMRTFFGVKGKAAALANFNRNQIFLQNAGTTVLSNIDSDINLAGLFDFGTYVKYSVTPSVRLTAGYDFWYIPGVATVPGQSLQRVNPQTGDKVQSKDELLLHGLSVGAQILY